MMIEVQGRRKSRCAHNTFEAEVVHLRAITDTLGTPEDDPTCFQSAESLKP